VKWQDLKILLVQLDMSVTDLAEELNCARPSLYLAFSKGNRPGVMKKMQDFYNKHRPDRPNPKQKSIRPDADGNTQEGAVRW
jgi:hypothetical protein